MRAIRTSLFLLLSLFAVLPIYGQENVFLENRREQARSDFPFAMDQASASEPMIAWYVANELYLRQEADSIKQLCDALLPELETLNDRAVYHYCIGVWHLRRNDIDDGQKALSEAGKLFGDDQNRLGEIFVRFQMSNVAYYSKQVEEAYLGYKWVLEQAETPAELQAKMHHNCGAVLMELQPILPDSSTAHNRSAAAMIRHHLDRAIQMSDSMRNFRAKAATYSVYVNLVLAEDKLDEAQLMIDSVKSISIRADDRERLAFMRIKEALLLDKYGKREAAKDTIQLAVDYFEEIGNQDQQIHAMSLLYKLLYDDAEFQDAADLSYDMYFTYKSYLDTTTARAIRRYREEFEAEKRELVINEQQAQLEADRLTLQNRNRAILALIFGLFGLAVLAWSIVQRNRRKAEREKDRLLLESREASIKAVLTAQEEERQRIAKDLHDGIVQQLGGLKLGLQKELTENSEGSRLLDLLDDSTKQLRDLSHRMMPKALKEFGLIPAMEDMLNNSLGNAGIAFDFEHHGMDRRLPEHVEITLYRIAQELINNVIKHSAAQAVSVQVIQMRGNAILIVEDDGKGFDSKQKEGGIGLMNISSRLDTVDGTVNFDASPGGGTLATVRIPIEK